MSFDSPNSYHTTKMLLSVYPNQKETVSSRFFLENTNKRTVGVYWNLHKDAFTFSQIKVESSQCTRRNILKIVALIFSPMGFISPFVVSGKVLLQELWRLKIEWDKLLDERIQTYWNEWFKSLSKINAVQIPRCHHALGYLASDVQLHIFCDASEVAHATVAYLKFLFKTDKPHCSFFMSKTRLAPIKTISLPRLELNAAVLGVKLYKLIIKEVDLPIQNITFWTDSVLVFQYIRNETHHRN